MSNTRLRERDLELAALHRPAMQHPHRAEALLQRGHPDEGHAPLPTVAQHRDLVDGPRLRKEFLQSFVGAGLTFEVRHVKG